jgi:hypothetical protein
MAKSVVTLPVAVLVLSFDGPGGKAGDDVALEDQHLPHPLSSQALNKLKIIDRY